MEKSVNSEFKCCNCWSTWFIWWFCQFWPLPCLWFKFCTAKLEYQLSYTSGSGIQSRPQVIASDSGRGGSQFSTIFKVSLCIFDGICLSARDYFYVSTHSALALFHSATAAHVGTTDGVVLHNVEINLATTSINSALDMHATENSFTVKVRITLQFNPDYLLIYFMKTDNCVFGLVKGIWSCCTAITFNFPHGTPHKWCI